MSIDELPGGRQHLGPEPVSAQELALVAAEIVAMIEHHRDELRVAMAELTALQRTVRSEIREAIQELDRIAAGDTAPRPSADAPDAPSPSRRPFRR
jgi:hypothetical protein